MGLAFDETANEKNAAVISTVDSAVQVKVLATEEDAQIARHVRAMMGGGA